MDVGCVLRVSLHCRRELFYVNKNNVRICDAMTSKTYNSFRTNGSNGNKNHQSNNCSPFVARKHTLTKPSDVYH